MLVCCPEAQQPVAEPNKHLLADPASNQTCTHIQLVAAMPSSGIAAIRRVQVSGWADRRGRCLELAAAVVAFAQTSLRKQAQHHGVEWY